MCLIKKKKETLEPHYVRIRLEDMFSVESIAIGTGELKPNGHFIEDAARQYGMTSLQANAHYARFVFPTKTIAKAFRKAIKRKVKEARLYPYNEKTINKA